MGRKTPREFTRTIMWLQIQHNLSTLSRFKTNVSAATLLVTKTIFTMLLNPVKIHGSQSSGKMNYSFISFISVKSIYSWHIGTLFGNNTKCLNIPYSIGT